ncbi:MAG: group 1 glycosyl [Desulfovibrionaceae bacterium]|nr:MAG: group 1 glycosyl [Desulfovibrionaceae bacterium]
MLTTRIWASLDPFLEAGPVLGRTQANAAFLRGLLRLDPYDAYRFYPASAAACGELSGKLQEAWPLLWDSARLQVVHRRELPRQLAAEEHHVFHLSDCILHPSHLAALRNACSRKIFPITSVTHSLSYARYGQDFLRHLSPCTTARDAVVATSRAAVDVVNAYYRTLRQGYGLDPAAFPQPQVRHIPLGVDLDAYSPPDEQRREQLRQDLGFGGEVVFLVLARLCHSSKMDFLPILRAFHRLILGGLPTDSVRLVLAGWTDEEDWGGRFLSDLARNIGLPLTVVERPSDQRKWELYAASDVFLSPSDNLQETFGLTLLEAQAMGLPVIASDFDGYRDLVEHGHTGELLPTLGPSVSAGVDLMAPMGFDNHTQLILAQRLAVDVAAMAVAMERMAGDVALRRRMGLNARQLAGSYSWESVAARHVELWDSLWLEDVPDQPAAKHPGSVAYADVFGGYPTSLLGPGVQVALSRLGNAVYRGQDYPIVYEGLSGMIDPEILRALLVLARKPVDAQALCERLRAAVVGLGQEDAQAHVLWCLKHDLLERADG